MTVFFYEETLGVLEKHGHKPEEVKYVFNKDFYCSWGDFYRRATLLYHNHKDWTAFGPTLMIVGDNWWLERYNFSGRDANVEKILFGHSKYDQRKEN